MSGSVLKEDSAGPTASTKGPSVSADSLRSGKVKKLSYNRPPQALPKPGTHQKPGAICYRPVFDCDPSYLPEDIHTTVGISPFFEP